MLLAAGLSGRRPLTAQTLKTVTDRGMLSCGVSQGLPGFSLPDDKGNWTGLDVDICRAIAAAIFNDPTKVKFVPLSAKDRFTALQSGEIDVLSRNTTWTLSRDTSLGANFTGVTYYDGQGFLVKKSLKVNSALELNSASVCVQTGTTNEQNLADYFKGNNMKYEVIAFGTADETIKAYESGRCDVFTSDVSQLYAERLKLSNPADHSVLPEVISKEPLGPMVRHGDDQWFDLVKWVLFAMIDAEELGVTQKNVDEMAKSDKPELKRAFGTDGNLGEQLGLPRIGYRGSSRRSAITANLSTVTSAPAQARNCARPQPALEQGRNSVRAADPLIAASGAAMTTEPRPPPPQFVARLRRALGGRAGWGGFVLQCCSSPRWSGSATRSWPTPAPTCSRSGLPPASGFLANTAGFDVSQRLIPYSGSDTYARVFLVGLLNTLVVAVIGIFFATVIGFLVALGRLSPNWLLSRISGGYVELVRNLPLLFQILFWYLAVLARAARSAAEHLAVRRHFSQQPRSGRFRSPLPRPGLAPLRLPLLIAIVGVTAAAAATRAGDCSAGRLVDDLALCPRPVDRIAVAGGLVFGAPGHV